MKFLLYVILLGALFDGKPCFSHSHHAHTPKRKQNSYLMNRKELEYSLNSAAIFAYNPVKDTYNFENDINYNTSKLIAQAIQKMCNQYHFKILHNKKIVLSPKSFQNLQYIAYQIGQHAGQIAINAQAKRDHQNALAAQSAEIVQTSALKHNNDAQDLYDSKFGASYGQSGGILVEEDLDSLRYNPFSHTLEHHHKRRSHHPHKSESHHKPVLTILKPKSVPEVPKLQPIPLPAIIKPRPLPYTKKTHKKETPQKKTAKILKSTTKGIKKLFTKKLFTKKPQKSVTKTLKSTTKTITKMLKKTKKKKK